MSLAGGYAPRAIAGRLSSQSLEDLTGVALGLVRNIVIGGLLFGALLLVADQTSLLEHAH